MNKMQGPSVPIRMIGLDLDGTVFNEKKEITEHTREVLGKAIQQGVVVLPATGRPAVGLPRQFLEIPGVRYAVTGNGSRILDLKLGITLYEEMIPWELALKAIAEMATYTGGCWEVYHQGKIYLDEENYRFTPHADMSPELLEYIRNSRIPCKNLQDRIRNEQWKIEKLHMMFSDTGERDRKMKILAARFPELHISCATTFNVEIISRKAGKGNGLLELGKILGITREEIMACGDAENDWDMLRKVGFPVAMGNADPETKKLAAFVTRSNQEDGVAWAVEQFVLRPSEFRNIQLRRAEDKDIPGILEIYREARESMRDDGFSQWDDGYPGIREVTEDISRKACWTAEKDGRILAVASLLFGSEDTYRAIYRRDGEKSTWPDQMPYGTIHRMAVAAAARRKGMASRLLEYMEKICLQEGVFRLRIDTHRENHGMRSWIQQQGFVFCGVIYVRNGSPRYAYQKKLAGEEHGNTESG